MDTIPKLLEIVYSPEHWNKNCSCKIPAMWEALVDTGVYVPRLSQNFVARIMGDTDEHALARAHEEYPGLIDGRKDGAS